MKEERGMRKLSLLVALMLALSVCAFAPAATMEKSAPTVLTWFYDLTYQNTDWGNDEISREFTNRTGIALDMSRAQTGDSEQINLMIASNDLTDLVCVHTDSVVRTMMRDSGMFMELKPLIDEYTPDFWDQMGEKYWEYWSSPIDGKNYFYANCTMSDLTSEKYLGFGPWNATTLVRHDIYEELGRPDMTTPESFIDVLVQVQENYPDIMPFFTGNNSDFALLSGYTNFGFYQRSFGIERFYEDEDGQIKAPIKDPNYVEFVKWLNQLYRKGIISRESFTYTEDQRNTIRDSGKVFAYNANSSDVGRVPAGAPDTYFEAVPPWPTMKMTQQTGLSWMSTFISNSCSDPEAAIKFLHYASSPEGDILLQWGIEGRDWVYDDKGAPRIPEETIQRRQSDWNSYAEESGYRTYNFGINFADHVIEYYTFTSNPMLKNVWDMHKNYSYAKLYMMSNDPDAGTLAAIIYQQVGDEFRQRFPEVVMAESESEAVVLFEKLVEDLYAMDLVTVETAWNEKAQRTKDIFGEENCVFYGIGMEGYHHEY